MKKRQTVLPLRELKVHGVFCFNPMEILTNQNDYLDSFLRKIRYPVTLLLNQKKLIL